MVDRLLKDYNLFTVARNGSACGSCIRVTVGFATTLDDINQCCYTSGHASADERLELDEDSDIDFDDPEAVHAWEGRALAHVAAQLQSGLQQAWSDVAGTLSPAGISKPCWR